MKKFDIPTMYRSPIISSIKEYRREKDRMKRDFAPTVLDFGPVTFKVARHFGFCYGVENAIEIIYKTIEENPGKRIFLLSEMIHNPHVNGDLQSRGVKFLQDTSGNQLVPWTTLTPEDIVVVPAFGTTVEIEDKLEKMGISVERYDTTCPFVEKVWKRSATLGADDYSILIHGKPNHEETRATFSHSKESAPSLIVKDMKEAEVLAAFIRKERPWKEFDAQFAGRYSEGFDPQKDLQKIGVVNQTTMLAQETQEIADFLGATVMEMHGEDSYADTRDTLCYATSDNQNAVFGMLEVQADLAIVIGGYNSSNTSHLVELCEEKLPTYHISGPDKLISKEAISHHLFRTGEDKITSNYLATSPVTILLSSGASCPDATVEQVIERILSFFPDARDTAYVLKELK